MKLKIYKTENEIEDICISYGLCKILEDNEIEYNLKDELSMYTIYTDNFDLEDLEWYDINSNSIINFINSSFNKSEIEKSIKSLNEFFNNRLTDVFKFYQRENISFNKCKAIGIGNVFYTFGVRASNSCKPLETLDIKRYLSFLGWIYSVSYCLSKDIETTVLLKPKNTNQFIRPFYFTYKDKETGEIKILTKINESGMNTEAQIYLKSLKEYKKLSKNYSQIIFIRQTPSGNKPIANKTYTIPINNLSIDLINILIGKISCDINIDIKNITSKYVLNINNYSMFSKLVKVYSKYNNTIHFKYLKELLKMQIERVQEIYNNEICQKLGYGLNRLLGDKKKKSGFEIQVKLYNIKNSKNLLKTVRFILDYYNRKFGKLLLNSNELNYFIDSIKDDRESEVFADAILSYAKVFINFEEKDKKEGNENE